MGLLWLLLFVALLGGPMGWLAQNRRLRRTVDALHDENAELRAERDAWAADADAAYRALTAARLVGHVPGRRHCIHHRYVRGAR